MAGMAGPSPSVRPFIPPAGYISSGVDKGPGADRATRCDAGLQHQCRAAARVQQVQNHCCEWSIPSSPCSCAFSLRLQFSASAAKLSGEPAVNAKPCGRHRQTCLVHGHTCTWRSVSEGRASIVGCCVPADTQQRAQAVGHLRGGPDARTGMALVRNGILRQLFLLKPLGPCCCQRVARISFMGWLPSACCTLVSP